MSTRLALLACLLVPAVATAGEFDTQLSRAEQVRGAEGLGALFWAQTAACREGSDLDRRQCLAVKEARARAVVDQLYVTHGDLVVSLGEYDAAKGGVPWTVRACLSCGEAAQIAGERRYVTGKGAVAIKGGALVGPELAKGVIRVASSGAARRWREVALPRLEKQVLFRVPPKFAGWSQGLTKGVTVEVVGVRVFDPCDGVVVHASPASDPVPGDPLRCPGGAAIEAEKPPEPTVPTGPVGPTLPDKLSTADIQATIAPTRPELLKCLEIYGIPGDARVTLDIAGADGSVKKAALRGEFEDTPTGECITKVLSAVQFPKFKSKSMTIRNVPFILR